jgi:hypothetical protein
MTNKSPVVGKIYKTKKEKVYVGHKDSEVLGVNKGLVWYFQDPKIFSKCEEYYHYEIVTIDRFWRTHEELPDSNSQKTEEEPTTKKSLQVERALEELKLKLKNDFWCESQYHYELLDSITNLIDALEVEKKPFFKVREEGHFEGSPPSAETYAKHGMSKPEPKIDTKKEPVELVSIWKDNKDELKELDKRNEQFLVRLKHGNGKVIMPIPNPFSKSNILTDNNEINKNIKEATTLTNFINSFEQMQKDIEELKRKC